MKYILYISLLLFTYSCKSKKTEEAPLNKLWKMGIDTITLPDNNAVLVPPFGSELVIDSSWIVLKPIKERKASSKKHNKEKTEQWIEIDENDTGINTIYNFGYKKNYDKSGGIHITDTATIRPGDSIPRRMSTLSSTFNIRIVPVYDTVKTIVSYVDTSVEARPNVIDWKYLYYVRRQDVLFTRDNYYLDLDKKRIKKSIVVLEARILDPK